MASGRDWSSSPGRSTTSPEQDNMNWMLPKLLIITDDEPGDESQGVLRDGSPRQVTSVVMERCGSLLVLFVLGRPEGARASLDTKMTSFQVVLSSHLTSAGRSSPSPFQFIPEFARSSEGSDHLESLDGYLLLQPVGLDHLPPSSPHSTSQS